MNIISKLQSDRVSFAHSVSETATKEYYIHCHNMYEIYFFLDGDADYLVEDRGYHLTPNSLLLLSPNVFHGLKINSAKPYQRYVLHFYPDVLSLERRHVLLSAFPPIGRYDGKEIFYPYSEEYRINSFFQSFAEVAKTSPELQQQLLPVYVEALLSQITIMSLSQSAAEADYNSSETVSKIISYLNSHLTEPFRLDAIAERFFISKHHLNKVFKKATGTTVYDYLLYKRIIYAQQLIINGSNAGEAALEAGFLDYSSFYRAYTKFLGHSPAKGLASFHTPPDVFY
ncbi:AraC family transcriptional regulator [Anaerocolumna cellulosilytica]|uniref:AraC family transcriptional regulator n=1 Tax=Anaerocolumna cellulosilytica TaxID=433286 RepID=A0A6S6R359_9FIRM|nr:helix-turn-helix domain-containing protein [Anaerocolumna cellulosilytica]MBB5196680.1 AraC-like DNA-binding protein [Anaerocolumna cellulosilytica]BCJ93942.1 AraC family transcriptional regulator [Anaerocolumna cellulosilytica]